jgi:two-component system phosphate regulon sensor histidine kinase PhoR
MKRRQLVRGVLIFLAVLAIFALVAYWAAIFTAYLATRLHWHISAPALSMTSSLIVLLCMGAVGNVLGRRFAGTDAFSEIRAALGRIAGGDFAIRLQDAENPTLKDLVASVNQMAAQLGQMETMRQEFISNVSHEIQSPLTSIRGFARLLRSEDLSTGQRSAYLEIIEAESTRLSRLSENLLMLAALESAEGELARTTYRLDKQIRTVILSGEPGWRAKEIEWDLRLETVTITAHEELLSQVWLNLLQNAIKFSHPEGRIAVDLVQRDDRLLVQVTDHGIGIATEDQIRIFERFYKADMARDRTTGGSGLGLAIARKIVALHGGLLTVQSELDAGSTFSVTLPIGDAPV